MMKTTVKTIEIMSEREAVKRASFEQRTFAIVSIKAPDGTRPDFPDNPNMRGLFRLSIYDIDQEQLGLKAPALEDFQGLRNYIDGLDTELLIVHCAAGISRSSATAAAISEYLEIPLQVFNNPRYIPNMLVYKLVREELGLVKTQAYYEGIFGGTDGN